MMTTVVPHSQAIVAAANSTPLPSVEKAITAFEARLVTQVHANLDHVTSPSFQARITNEQLSFASHITKPGGSYTPIAISTLTFEASAPVLSVQVVAANHVSLSWTTVGGATSYTVEMSSGKSRVWTTVTTTAGTTAGISNLATKTLYRFRVTASNGSVNSTPSKVVSVTPSKVVAAEQRQAKAVALSVQRFQRSLSRYVEANAAKSGNSHFQNHVLALQKAFAQRLAHTGAVYQPQSISSELVGNVGADAGPTVTATTVSANEIDLSWPAYNGAIVYLVEVSADGGTTWKTDAYTFTNAYDDVNLTPETSLTYRVSATTSSETTDPGATATAITLPASPRSLVITSDAPTTSGASFTLSWGPVAGATDYHVTYSTDPSQLTTSAAAMIDAGASTSASIGGLSTGTTYFVSVQAIDATFQESAPSNVASILTTPDTPTVTGSSPSTTEVDLSWNAIPTATSYTVLKETSGTWAPDGAAVTGTSFADTKLSADTKYAFEVVANNTTGAGVPSSETDVATLMNAPSGFTATASNNSLTTNLSWNTSDATSYIVQRSTDELNWGNLTGTATIGDNSVTFPDTTGLNAGMTYYYRVIAVNNSGDSAPSAIQSALMVPGTPTLAVSSISSSEIDLNWQPVFGATSYKIERSSPDDTSFATIKIANQGPGFYADTTAAADTEYFYRITAVNATGALAPSTEESATTHLGAVQGLTATASTTTNGEIDLSWTPLADATSYTLLRKVGNGAWATDSSAQTAGDTSITVSDTGLADGTNYSYAVVANDAIGAGLQSASVSALTLPGAPTLTATSVSGTEIDLSWAAMPGASSYVLQSSPDAGTTWTTITLTNPAATTFADTGLIGNTAYEFEVNAVNATGSSPLSSVASATTLLPSPTDFTVTPVSGNGTIVALSWTAVTNADTYTLRRSTPDATHWVVINAAIAGADQRYIDQTALPGTKYYYSLTAVSQTLGSSAPVIASGTTVPGIPVVTATPVSASEIDLTWPAVQGATSYSVAANLNGAGWSVVSTTATSPYMSTGLTPDTAEAYKVIAVNGSGNSGSTPEIDATTRIAGPANLTAGAVSSSAIRLSWTAVTDAVSYQVARSTTPTAGPWTVLTTLTSPTANTYTDSTGLSPTTHYYYRVDAINANGASAWSTADTTTLMVSPQGLKAVATAANITVTWSPVTGASDYVLIRSSGSSWVQQTLSAKGVLTFTDTHFDPDTTYQYEVGAIGTNTTSAFSAPVSVTTLLSAPTGLTTSPTPTGVALSWNPVTDATGYVITRTQGSAKGVVLTTTGLTGSSSTFFDSTALGNTNYSYTISAVNALGTSLPSTAVAQLTCPAQPTGVKAVANPDGTLTLSWAAVTGITQYSVQQFNGLTWAPITPNPTTNSFNITAGLIPDVAYTFQVIAGNNAGSSLPSATVTATTVQASPTGLAATSPKGTEIDLSWTAQVDATGYVVQRSTDNKAWTTVVAATAKSAATTAADTTVTAGTTYYYRLSTITAAGTGAPSTALQTVSRPATVGLASITNVSSSSLTLLWAAVPGATNYQINIQQHGASTWTPLASTSGVTFQVNGLTADTGYSFQLIASNYAGASGAGPTSSITTLLGTVQNLTVVPGAPGSGQVNLSWNALRDATSFVVDRSTDNKTFTKDGTATANGSNGVVFSDKTIAANTTYYYEVAAVDGFGTGAFSPAVQILTLPASPALPTVTNATASEIDISWAPVAGVSQYFVEINNGLTGWQGLTETSSTTCSATGLAANTNYQFRVSSINLTGPSATSPVLTETTAPTTIATLSAKVASATEIDLAWTAPANATGFTLRRSTDNSTWTNLAPSPALTKTSVSYADKTVKAGTTYYYEISVTNATGKSAFGTAVSALTLPGVPTGLAGTPSGASQITLTWTATPSAISYLIERTTGTTWAAVGSSPSTTYIDTGLASGTAYQYRVTAINATGKSAATAGLTVTSALAPVTGLTLVDTSATDVTISWTPVTGAAKYKIERSINNTTWTTLSLTTTGATATVDDKTVVAGTTYYYRITALAAAAAGNSAVSPVKVVTTLLAAPAAPTATVVTGPEIDLSWKAVTGAIGYVLQESATGTSGWTALTTTNAAVTSYKNTGLTAKTKYFYRLIAVNIAGNSLPSAVVSATTGAT